MQRERDVIEVDVLFVGGGAASLAGAIKLAQCAKAGDRELSILVIEKGADFGNHSLSGAVFNRKALDELFPRDIADSAPLGPQVTQDELWVLSTKRALQSTFVPQALANTGKRLLSLNAFVAWLAERATELGVDCLPEFPGRELLFENDRVVGVRIGDKGIDAHGQPLSNYEPGADIRARITILGEGVRGTLAKVAIAKLDLLKHSEPQNYALGVKELWQLQPGKFAAGRVVHTLGAPLPGETFGGGWLYGFANDQLSIGLVVGLDSPDPSTDAHDAFNRFKNHPKIREILDGATLIRYGAKAIPEGGLFALPRLCADGLMLIGDTAGFVDGLRLKGIHLAMKSGMLAAESAFTALMSDRSDASALGSYETAVKASWITTELRTARNVHQGFEHGRVVGLINAAFGTITAGRGYGIFERLHGSAAYARVKRIDRAAPKAEHRRITPDGVLTFDKVSDVFYSGTRHDERQPSHLLVADTTICADRCTKEYGNPCKRFCPADVYHPEFTVSDGVVSGALRIDFANCVHCKTCDIVDPYQIITWVPPQGGDGPVYTGL